MKITIVGRQQSVSDEQRDYVTKKLHKLEKFFPETAEAKVSMGHMRDKQRMEITIVSKGTIFRSEEMDDSYMNALDLSIATIEGQIRKNKTKLSKKIKDGVLIDKFNDSGEEIESEESDRFTIKTKSFEFKPMTPEEAILQMDLLGHQFFVFTNAETGDTCVVYKRHDDSYGLIEPSIK